MVSVPLVSLYGSHELCEAVGANGKMPEQVLFGRDSFLQLNVVPTWFTSMHP